MNPRFWSSFVHKRVEQSVFLQQHRFEKSHLLADFPIFHDQLFYLVLAGFQLLFQLFDPFRQVSRIGAAGMGIGGSSQGIPPLIAGALTSSQSLSNPREGVSTFPSPSLTLGNPLQQQPIFLPIPGTCQDSHLFLLCRLICPCYELASFSDPASDPIGLYSGFSTEASRGSCCASTPCSSHRRAVRNKRSRLV